MSSILPPRNQKKPCACGKHCKRDQNIQQVEIGEGHRHILNAPKQALLVLGRKRDFLKNHTPSLGQGGKVLMHLLAIRPRPVKPFRWPPNVHIIKIQGRQKTVGAVWSPSQQSLSQQGQIYFPQARAHRNMEDPVIDGFTIAPSHNLGALATTHLRKSLSQVAMKISTRSKQC